jgi:hypothetical protein
MVNANNEALFSFKHAVASQSHVHDTTSRMTGFLTSQPMKDAALFTLPSIAITISMALLTMWIYPRAAWGLQNSGKQSAKLCQRFLPSTLFQATVVLGLYHIWSCWKYIFRMQPSLPTAGEIPWCIGMSCILFGVIGLHLAMVFFVATADARSQMKQTVDDLCRTCIVLDQDACAGCECSICFAELSDPKGDGSLPIAPRCGHSFHKRCLRVWLAHNPTCPMCRHDLHTDLNLENDVSSM